MHSGYKELRSASWNIQRDTALSLNRFGWLVAVKAKTKSGGWRGGVRHIAAEVRSLSPRMHHPLGQLIACEPCLSCTPLLAHSKIMLGGRWGVREGNPSQASTTAADEQKLKCPAEATHRAHGIPV